MKRLQHWILLGLLAAQAYAGPFSIDKFQGEDVGDPDAYIAAEFSNQLRKADPNQIQDGRFYVRQKSEDPFGDEASTYQLYQGRPTAARNKLGKFTLQDVPYATLIKAKFFLNRGASGDDDIEKVYFDGKSVFVEGEDPIYAKIDGKMMELTPSVDREYAVSLSSQPTGAEVKVDGVRKGATPLNFTVNTTQPVVAVVSKNGYYTTFKVLKAVSGKTLQEGILLNPKKDLENPVNALRAKLLEAKKKNDTKAIKALQATVQSKVDGYASESSKAIDAIMAKYPPLPPQASGESPETFASRKSLWEEDRNTEKSSLESAAQSYEAALQDLQKEISATLNGEPYSLRYIYIPNTALSFGNMGVKDFVVSASHSVPELDLSYSNAKLAYGRVSKAELVAAKDKVHAVAKVWNVADANGKFSAFYDMAFFYDETPLTLLKAGNTDTQADAQAKAKAKEYSAKAKKESTDWKTKDSEATVAALRQAGKPVVEEVAAPAPAPVAKEESEDSEDAYSPAADSAQMASTISESTESDYSSEDAEYDVTDRFGNTDEYIRWAAWGLAGTAVVTGVIGILEHRKYNEAKDAYDNTADMIATVKESIATACEDKADQPACQKAMIAYASQAPTGANNDRPLYTLNSWQKDNKSAKDSYNTSRILWLSLSAASIAGSVVLFTW